MKVLVKKQQKQVATFTKANITKWCRIDKTSLNHWVYNLHALAIQQMTHLWLKLVIRFNRKTRAKHSRDTSVYRKVIIKKYHWHTYSTPPPLWVEEEVVTVHSMTFEWTLSRQNCYSAIIRKNCFFWCIRSYPGLGYFWKKGWDWTCWNTSAY